MIGKSSRALLPCAAFIALLPLACRDDPAPPPQGQPSTSTTLDAGSATVIPPPIPTPVPPPVVLPNPAVITADVQDVAVPIGGTAVFRVVATGTSLTYQWQEGSVGTFTDLLGQTGATLTLANVTEVMAAKRYRVIVGGGGASVTSRDAALSLFFAGQTGDVFVQHPPSAIDRHPTTISTTGAGYACSADMATGTFRSRVDANTPTPNPHCYAGFLAPLTFVNNTGAAITIPAGAIKVETEGTYSHTPAAGRNVGSIATTILSADGTTVSTSASGRHQWGIAYDAEANPTSFSFSRFEEISNTGGGTSSATIATYSALKMVASLGAITLAPGGRFNLRYTLTLQVQHQSAIADLETVPTKLTMTLPAGISLDRNTNVPLAWVTNAP